MLFAVDWRLAAVSLKAEKGGEREKITIISLFVISVQPSFTDLEKRWNYITKHINERRSGRKCFLMH